jgi:hypothetical protein
VVNDDLVLYFRPGFFITLCILQLSPSSLPCNGAVGNFIFLVPYRNKETPENGQRGHGLVVRIDMNEISQQSENLKINLGWRGEVDRTTALSEPATRVGWKGITWLDLTTTQRTQVPNSSDPDLRGYYAGFGCKSMMFDDAWRCLMVTDSLVFTSQTNNTQAQ